jgi:signal transduction histidine kinase
MSYPNYLTDQSHNLVKQAIQVDRDRIMQVISNLLDNAIKFTPQGFVSVVISGPMEYKECQGNNNHKEVVVSVEDTGSGIDPEIFPKLFTNLRASHLVVLA